MDTNPYYSLYKKKQEEITQEKQNFYKKMEPIIEFLECSYLVDITTMREIQEVQFHSYTTQLTYNVFNIQDMLISISLEYEEGHCGAEDLELVKFTCRYGSTYRFVENYKCIYLYEADLDKIIEIIKILCLQTAIEMNLKNDANYFNTFFNINN